MLVFSYDLSKAVLTSFGLNYPEHFQLHSYTRLSSVVGVFNFILGRGSAYAVWKHQVHLSEIGQHQLYTNTFNTDELRSLLQKAERTPWKTLWSSLRSR